MEEYIQVFTTAEKKEDAERIAKNVVEKRLAACVQIIGPASSTYWWKNNVETSSEWLIIMKTKKNVYPKLEKSIKELHPYEVPEILAMPVVAGSKQYLEWLDNETK
jgi:periplasmic divalent cation tolerance protein